MSQPAEQSVQIQYRKLPSVDAVLGNPEVRFLVAEHGLSQVTDTVRGLMASVRKEIANGGTAPQPEQWPFLLHQRIARETEPELRTVINATGVVIHTNLGRAPLCDAARLAMDSVTAGYSNLEYDLSIGERGSRYDHAKRLLCELTGAEDAIVLNNCAAAIFLALSALCNGREVVVSRGQLVEIGGGFRIPDVLRQSGGQLVEVGTTNRTHPSDFANAISDRTAALMRIHASNFRQIGFTATPALTDLVTIAQSYSRSNMDDNSPAANDNRNRILVIDDLGSGTLIDTTKYGLSPEPMVQESIKAGADLVAFSGDKLLGGPQAGMVVGRKACIARLRTHPLTRALRVDKMTLAALEATLRIYAAGRAEECIPVWQMIGASKDDLSATADRWQRRLLQMGVATEIWPGESTIGGGSLPGETLPTTLVALSSSTFGSQVDGAAARLREGQSPVICRIQRDCLVFDPRTVLSSQEDQLLQAIKSC